MDHFAATPLDGAVWITGGSKGIGAETAIALANAGFRVYISARSQAELESVAKRADEARGKIIPLVLDVTDRNACEKALSLITKESGSIAIAILNAGTFIPVSAHELNYETFDNTMNVNFIGVVNCLLPAVEAMKKAGKGQLAIVASVAGYGGLKKSASYGASKAALINMAESLKFDLDAMNIKIQIVTPGFIDTPLTEKNKFKMPFLMSASDAAERIIAGLKKDRFEITFPRRFTFMLKFVNILPYFLYFRVMGIATRSRK